MPERHFDRHRGYSPPSTTSTISTDRDRYDRRAVQPYSHRDPRAMQPYDPRDRDRAVTHRRSDSTLGPSTTTKGSRTEQGTAWMKDHGAELIGAAAGGLAGRKAGSDGDHLKTASGAAVGAIGAKVVERQYRKWNDKREDKKVGREVRRGYDDERYSSESDLSDDGYSRPPPPRRYSRSLDRGRERDRSPQGWRDVGRKIRRSLSRKKVKEEDERRY